MVTTKVENLIDFVANVFGPVAGVDAVLIPGEPESQDARRPQQERRALA
jgi:hypothetical protein